MRLNRKKVYPTVPDKMVMVLAMIFGAHLLPFGWLYESKSYMAMSVIITTSVLIVGLNFDAYIVSSIMILFLVYYCFLKSRNSLKIYVPR